MNCDICNVSIPDGADAKEQHEMGKRHIKLRAQKESAQTLAETSVFVKWKTKQQIAEQIIREVFMQFGSIERILLRSERSFAIVEFTEKSSAEKAISTEKIIISEINATIEKRKVDFGEIKSIKPHFNISKVLEAINVLSTFIEQADALIKHMVLSEEEVNQRLVFISDLQTALQEYLYKPRVVLFGSTVTGIGTIDSDMDATVFLQDPPNVFPGMLRDKYTLLTCDVSCFKGRKVTYGELIRLTSADRVRLVSKIINEIRKTAGWIGHQNPVLDARCPVVRFLIKSRYLIDLSVENSLGVQKSFYFKHLIEADESQNLKRILITLRFWALCCGLFKAPTNQHTGQFNAYILNLYAIYYLMLHEQIPHIKSCSPRTMDNERYTIFNIERYSLKEIDLPQFFKKFFVDTVEQSFSEAILGPFEQIALKKQEFEKLIELSDCKAAAKLSIMNILDPIEPTHNVAQNVADKMCSLMKRKMMFSLSAMKKSKNHRISDLVEVDNRVNINAESSLNNVDYFFTMPHCSAKDISLVKRVLSALFEEILYWDFKNFDEPEIKRMKLEDSNLDSEKNSLWNFGQYVIRFPLWIGRRNIKRKILHDNPELLPLHLEKKVSEELIKHATANQEIAVVQPQIICKGSDVILTLKRITGCPSEITNVFHFISTLISNINWSQMAEII